MNASTSTALTYLQLLFHGADDGFIGISKKTPSGLASRAFPVAEIAEAASYAVEHSAFTDVWVECSLQVEPPASRGREAGVSHFGVLTADFDIKSEAHKQAALPATQRDLGRLLSSASAPAPTFVVHTGNGLLAGWVLEQPIAIRNAADLASARALSKAFQGRLREVALRDFGWRLDPTADLVRLLRIPGTLNHKSVPPRPVAMASEEWAS